MTFHRRMKKANIVLNSIVFIIVIVTFSLISLFGWKIWGEIRPDIVSDVNMTEAEDVMNEVNDRYTNVIDGLILLIFVGMWLFGCGAAYFSSDHPFLFGMMLILVVFVIIAGVILGNFYEELFTDSDLSTISADFPVTNWIMSHMLIIGIVISMSMALFYFGKGGGE